MVGAKRENDILSTQCISQGSVPLANKQHAGMLLTGVPPAPHKLWRLKATLSPCCVSQFAMHICALKALMGIWKFPHH